MVTIRLGQEGGVVMRGEMGLWVVKESEMGGGLRVDVRGND